MKKISLKPPYKGQWKRGYLVINRQNRAHVLLYNSHNDRTTTSYARYKMSVKLGRFLDRNEVVDHVDEDKTNDKITNLQIISSLENAKKQGKFRGTSMVDLRCPACGKVFAIPKRNSFLTVAKCLTLKSCSRECANIFKARPPIPVEERVRLIKSLFVREYVVH